MKGKFLLLSLVLVMPLALAAQNTALNTTQDTAQDTRTAAATAVVPTFQRYEVYGGAAYSSANHTKGSSALYGYNVGGEARLKPWFGGAVDFGQYSHSTTSVQPTMTTVMAGPAFFLPSDKLLGTFHVLFGDSHMGNIAGAKPNLAFTYAVGGGFDYIVHKNWSLRATGDAISSDFVIDPNNLGYSPQRRINARATLAIGYHF